MWLQRKARKTQLFALFSFALSRVIATTSLVFIGLKCDLFDIVASRLTSRTIPFICWLTHWIRSYDGFCGGKLLLFWRKFALSRVIAITSLLFVRSRRGLQQSCCKSCVLSAKTNLVRRNSRVELWHVLEVEDHWQLHFHGSLTELDYFSLVWPENFTLDMSSCVEQGSASFMKFHVRVARGMLGHKKHSLLNNSRRNRAIGIRLLQPDARRKYGQNDGPHVRFGSGEPKLFEKYCLARKGTERQIFHLF